MKAKLLLVLSFLVPSFAFATQHHVLTADFTFNPSSLTGVHVGDTVMWMWVSGAHTTTSVSIPAGAAPWDAMITSSTTSFSYKVTVAGTYNYKCTPHAPNMSGSFVALPATGVGGVKEDQLAVFPNPASSMLQVKFSDKAINATVQLFNTSGAVVFSARYVNAQDATIDLRNQPAGIYYVRVNTADNTVLQQVITKY